MSTDETPVEQPIEIRPETIEFLTWLAETPSELERFEKLVEYIQAEKHPAQKQTKVSKSKPVKGKTKAPTSDASISDAVWGYGCPWWADEIPQEAIDNQKKS